MSIDHDRAPARLTIVRPVANENRLPAVTVEEADEARRHAAEIGDYVAAQRWHWHERLLATREDRTERP